MLHWNWICFSGTIHDVIMKEVNENVSLRVVDCNKIVHIYTLKGFGAAYHIAVSIAIIRIDQSEYTYVYT